MRKVMNMKGFLLIMTLMLAAFFIVHAVLRGQYREKARQESDLLAQVVKLEEENRSLSEQLEVVGSKEYIVSSAMGNYDYMNKDDIRFVYTNPEALYAYTENEIRILMDELAD